MKGVGGVMNKSQDLSVSSNPPPAPPQPQLTALTMACSILLSMALTPLLLELRGGAGGGQNGAVMGCASPLPHSPGVCVGPTIAQRGVGGVATSPSFPTSPPPHFLPVGVLGMGKHLPRGSTWSQATPPSTWGSPKDPGAGSPAPPNTWSRKPRLQTPGSAPPPKNRDPTTNTRRPEAPPPNTREPETPPRKSRESPAHKPTAHSVTPASRKFRPQSPTSRKPHPKTRGPPPNTGQTEAPPRRKSRLPVLAEPGSRQPQARAEPFGAAPGALSVRRVGGWGAGQRLRDTKPTAGGGTAATSQRRSAPPGPVRSSPPRPPPPSPLARCAPRNGAAARGRPERGATGRSRGTAAPGRTPPPPARRNPGRSTGPAAAFLPRPAAAPGGTGKARRFRPQRLPLRDRSRPRRARW